MGGIGDALRGFLGREKSGPSGGGEPADREPHAGRRRAILLRRVFPPDRRAETVGHLGGLPRLPEGVAWPRQRGSGEPMTFVAAIDLARLPALDDGPQLPREGALFAFVATSGESWCDDDHPGDEMGALIHVPEGIAGAPERRPPADAPPCYGEEWRFQYKSLADEAYAPRRFPHWPIEARAVDSFCEAVFDWSEPPGEIDRRLGEARRLNEAAASAAYGQDLPKRRYHEGVDPLPPEPYPEFWAMIAAAAGKIGFDNDFAAKSKWSRVSDKARPAYLEAVAEAKAWEDEALAHDPWDPPSDVDRRRFRDWVATLHAREYFTPDKDYGSMAPTDDVFLVASTTVAETVNETLDQLVAEDAARLRAAIPDVERRIAWRHAVAYRTGDETTVVAYQMLGWGAEIQDMVARRRDDVLLLQLDSDYGIGWMWGDVGVIQFWMAPEDLKDRRFDRVTVTFECH